MDDDGVIERGRGQERTRKEQERVLLERATASASLSARASARDSALDRIRRERERPSKGSPTGLTAMLNFSSPKDFGEVTSSL